MHVPAVLLAVRCVNLLRATGSLALDTDCVLQCERVEQMKRSSQDYYNYSLIKFFYIIYIMEYRT